MTMLRQLLRAEDAEPLVVDLPIGAVLTKRDQGTINFLRKGLPNCTIMATGGGQILGRPALPVPFPHALHSKGAPALPRPRHPPSCPGAH